MCCPTGLCGVSIDPELLRMAALIETLKAEGVTVERYNLSQSPMAFISEKVVAAFLKTHSSSALPLTLVDGEVFVSGRYPGEEELRAALAK